MVVGRPRARSKIAAVLSICGTTALYNFQLLTDHDDARRPQAGLRRSLSNALPEGGCEITWPKKPPADVEITYAASYPGCGARMTWNLVEALTGLETGDDWNNNGRGEEVVTVKTHYPQSNGILVEFDDKIKRVFVVIRNPMKSIPSFFNHIYEMRNHLPVHSERAPLEEWLKWRDAYLDIEIAEYMKFIIYWMERYSPENRLLLTYEGLTDDLIGPEVTKGLNEFLGMARGVTPIHKDSVACIWRAVVKNKPPEHQAAQFKKLQSQALNQPQGTSQKEESSKKLERHLVEQPAPINAAILPGQAPPQIQPKPLQGPISGGGPSDVLSLKEQYLRNSAIPLQAPQQVRPQEAQITKAQQQQQPSDADDGEVDPLDVLMEEMQKILAGGNELLKRNQLEYEREIQEGAQPQQQRQLREIQDDVPHYELGHRRLDPGHHNSQRSGPDVPRPYLPRHLDSMMNMLLEVANRYETKDVRLYHIMMGYYEQIRSERAKMNSDEPLNVKSSGGFY